MRLGDPLNVLLSSHLTSLMSAPWLWHVALALGSCPGPVRYAAVQVLAKEVGMWGQEEMLPCVLRSRVCTYLNFW